MRPTNVSSSSKQPDNGTNTMPNTACYGGHRQQRDTERIPNRVIQHQTGCNGYIGASLLHEQRGAGDVGVRTMTDTCAAVHSAFETRASPPSCICRLPAAGILIAADGSAVDCINGLPRAPGGTDTLSLIATVSSRRTCSSSCTSANVLDILAQWLIFGMYMTPSQH